MTYLIRPIITEKTSAEKASGKIYFRVRSDANKIQIKEEIEKLFAVKVEKVNTVNVSGKTKRKGRIVGRTSNWKKAIVVLKKGDKIKEYEELF